MYLKLKGILTSTDGINWTLTRIFYLTNKDSIDGPAEYKDAYSFGLVRDVTKFLLVVKGGQDDNAND